MIICICHRVTDSDIARAARDGCASFDELQFDLGVATSCGKCHDCARETFRQHAATDATGTGTLWPGCCGHPGHGAVISIATPHRRDPTTPAVA